MVSMDTLKKFTKILNSGMTYFPKDDWQMANNHT